MKRLLYLLPLLLASQCWGQTLTLVQRSANGTSGATPVTATLTSTAAGNAIGCVAGVRSASGLSVSDPTNGTYTATSLFVNGSDGVQGFYILNGAGNSGTLTITISGTASPAFLNCREYHTTSGTWSFDGAVGTTSPGSSSTPTSDSLTTTGTDVLFGGVTSFNASSGGCGTGFSNSSGNTNTGAIVVVQCDDIGVSAGSHTFNFTLNAAQTDWMAAGFALKASGGGAPSCGQSIAMLGVGCR